MQRSRYAEREQRSELAQWVQPTSAFEAKQWFAVSDAAGIARALHELRNSSDLGELVDKNTGDPVFFSLGDGGYTVTFDAEESLITCTGLWLPQINDYAERLVVRAELVA